MANNANYAYYLKGGTKTLAAAGTTTADATLITAQCVLATGANNAGFRLPIPYAGAQGEDPYAPAPILFVNTEVSNTLKVYPMTGGVIDGGATDAAISVTAGTQIVIWPTGALHYRSITGTISAAQAGYLTGLTPGTVTASKAVVVDSSKNIATFGTLGCGAITSGGEVATSTSANALAVGRQGSTNPVLNVDASVSTNVTGVNIVGRAAAAGVDITATSSGTDEDLRLNAKGAGLFGIGRTSTGIVDAGLGSAKGVVVGGTKTSLATQNITPTAAQLLGGYISHASTTGAGTNTLPLASALDTALGAAAVTGAVVVCDYANTGSQTVTLTTNTGWTLVGTVAVGSGKNARIIMRRTGSGTWDALQIVSA